MALLAAFFSRPHSANRGNVCFESIIRTAGDEIQTGCDCLVLQVLSWETGRAFVHLVDLASILLLALLYPFCGLLSYTERVLFFSFSFAMCLAV